MKSTHQKALESLTAVATITDGFVNPNPELDEIQDDVKTTDLLSDEHLNYTRAIQDDVQLPDIKKRVQELKDSSVTE